MIKNILICPLEWGLGHAARMIPVARRLREMNYNVFIGAGEEHLALFRAELPGLNLISFPGFRPSYSRHLPQYLAMLMKTPLLLYHIIREHHRLKRIIRDYSIDLIISDNRFGLWNKDIKSVYVTHLPRIPLPAAFRLFEFTGVLLHRAVMKKYTLCLIPDLPGDLNVSGRLSHIIRLPANTIYAGIISRFILTQEDKTGKFSFPHNTVILSGPEPQRSMLKHKLVSLLKHRLPRTVILEGKPGKSETSSDGNIIFYSHLTASEMAALIRTSDTVITRSGYTTIMDLICLGSSAVLIPTPGQTEQEYLAEYLDARGWFSSVSQNRISENMPVPPETSLPDEIVEKSRVLFEEALHKILED
ncbi:MAG: glycosyltransferase [Chloroflexota bacterium]